MPCAYESTAQVTADCYKQFSPKEGISDLSRHTYHDYHAWLWVASAADMILRTMVAKLPVASAKVPSCQLPRLEP